MAPVNTVTLAILSRSAMRADRAMLERVARAGLAAALCGVVGCEDARGTAGGTVIIGTAQDAETLLPPFASRNTSRAITDLLFEKLADIGPALNTLGDAGFQPRLATGWEWSRDSLAVTFHLDPLARWHDGQAVRAADVQFAFSVYRDSLVGARGSGDLSAVLDSISIHDSITCTAWFRSRSPERFNTLVGTLLPLPGHLLGHTPPDSLRSSPFSRMPVGNGPFRFVRWEPQQRVELAANVSYHRGRPILDRVIWAITPQGTTLVQQLLGGGVDFVEFLAPDDASAVARAPALRLLRRVNFDYGVAQLNLRDGATGRSHPLFGDRRLRRALAMALDRGLMLRSVFGTGGSSGLGPFVRAQWSSDTTVVPVEFNRTAAARLLDSLGWRAGADGMRARGGRPLAFTLLVPTSSKSRSAFAVLLQEQLRQTGIRVEIELLDFSAFSARTSARRFDAAMQVFTATPSPSGLRQTWTTSAARNDGFNYGRYENAVFDALVDSAITDTDLQSARRHYRLAYQTIVDDAPALWLYEPPPLAAVNRRVQLPPLRADAWWLSIPSWSATTGAPLVRTPTAVPKS